MAKSVKLADIAEIMNVSTVTVSKALSGQKGVSEQMREKIVKLAQEMGYKKRWLMSVDYHIGGPGDNKQSDLKGAKWDWTLNFKPMALQAFKFKVCAFKTKDAGGKFYAAKVTLDFLGSEYKEPHSSKNFDFGKFNNTSKSNHTEQGSFSKHRKFKKFDDYSDDEQVDPIQSDTGFLFDNNDAIVFDINKRNENNT